MTKILKLAAIPFLILGLSACSLFSSDTQDSLDTAQTPATISPIANTQSSQEKTVNTENSKLKWRGEFITGDYGHDGLVPITSGVVGFNNQNELVAGNFTLDIQNLSIIDLEGEVQKTLLDHLKSKDFFDTENHPQATLNITSTEKIDNDRYSITADLTIKDISNSIQFQADINQDQIKSMFNIDRTRWNINYASGKFFDNLKDSAINDEIMFDILLELE